MAKSSGHESSLAALDRQQKERDAIRFRREIADLRRKIQTLASCVTPMGREMDEVQIAVDVMLQANEAVVNERPWRSLFFWFVLFELAFGQDSSIISFRAR